ncbi:MAG: hypothetical protein ACI8UR_000941 [Natronomonas sp.]|jgi:hypothetical protein|uniref:DUF7331 family protein n=1 Tax=Natronomonas sp. TaxID=2184060 RepID=UPI0039896803
MPAPPEHDRDDALPVRRSQCVVIELENGEVIIYDTENHSAWLQSDAAVEL